MYHLRSLNHQALPRWRNVLLCGLLRFPHDEKGRLKMIPLDLDSLDDLRAKAKELAEFGAPYVEISDVFVKTIDLLDTFASDNRESDLLIHNQRGTIEAQKDEIIRLRNLRRKSDD